ncbi:Na/Pi cotransporter family protein [Oscillospiraceae bacterium LTW-04]|nr:Na/Pi cotransporter family protein [Oscillospiraceae bacterium MB24-C1]
MTILNLIAMGGGVALFLYGMSVMGNGLEKISGGKMEKALEKLTGNILSSVALGAVVTAVLQSSSATTVIVVGLVNAGIMQLRQAAGVIMGANIGTTVTAQLIRLSDIDSSSVVLRFFKPSTLAPLAAMVGILMYMASKKAKRREIGQMLVGFGILFAGMFSMEAAVAPLRDSPAFINALTAMSNPVLGVLAGAIVTAIIQSSSASVGMLQAISSTGVLYFSTAFPIIMGQNIGTCITPLISSIGASKNAKRSALLHLYFNIIGTMAFLTAAYGLKAMLGAPSFWNETIGRTGIANFHTFFNIVVTVLLIPFARVLERLAYTTIKDDGEGEKLKVLELLDERLLKSPSIALQQCDHMITKMGEYAQQNFLDSVALLAKFDSKTVDRINENENLIDKMEDKLEHYLIKLSAQQVSDDDNRAISIALHMVKDYERISDYCTNLMECADEMESNGVAFSQQALDELDVLILAVNDIIDTANKAQLSSSIAIAKRIEPLEETIDAIVERLKDMHVERLKSGECNIHSGIVFLEILTNLERIADHCSNIGLSIIGNKDDRARYESHEYIKRAHESGDSDYVANYQSYMNQYYNAIQSDYK